MVESDKKTEDRIEWQWFPMPFNPFFDIYKRYTNLFLRVIRRYGDTCDNNGKKISKIKIKHRDGYEYKFLFDWQDDVVCGIEIYRRLNK